MLLGTTHSTAEDRKCTPLYGPDQRESLPSKARTNVIKLPVPYRSQWADDAKSHSADCGPTCLAMVLNYYGVKMTPDGVYRFMPPKGPKEFTRIGELMQASRSNGVPNSYKKFVSRDEALSNLRASLDDG
ncbi:MAG TPA: C39 family peptidase, partial [Anaerolineae bacterium]|nr:C39 family peptidase [Anaerolineae bacterium]